MIRAIDQICGGQSVPESHDKHRQHVPEIGARSSLPEPFAAQRCHAEAGVDIVAQKRGERNVPPGPEILHVNTPEGLVEIFRLLDAEQIRRSDRHAAVACEVKKHEKRIAVHVPERPQKRIGHA